MDPIFVAFVNAIKLAAILRNAPVSRELLAFLAETSSAQFEESDRAEYQKWFVRAFFQQRGQIA